MPSDLNETAFLSSADFPSNVLPEVSEPLTPLPYELIPQSPSTPIVSKQREKLGAETAPLRAKMVVRNRRGTGNIPCEFPGCTRSYSRRDSMLRHMKIHRIDNVIRKDAGTGNIPCDFPGCTKRYVHKRGMLHHKRTEHVVIN